MKLFRGVDHEENTAYCNVNEEKNCVRPAIVVKTSGELWKKAGTVKKSKK